MTIEDEGKFKKVESLPDLMKNNPYISPNMIKRNL